MPRTTKPIPTTDDKSEEAWSIEISPELEEKMTQMVQMPWNLSAYVLEKCRDDHTAIALYHLLYLQSHLLRKLEFTFTIEEIQKVLRVGKHKAKDARASLVEAGLIKMIRHHRSGRLKYSTRLIYPEDVECTAALFTGRCNPGRPILFSKENNKRGGVPTAPLPSLSQTDKKPSNTVQQRHLNLAQRVLRTQKKNWPGMSKVIERSSPEISAVTLERLERIDGYSWEDVKGAVLWAIEDDFWSRNVITCAGLRDKKRGSDLHKFSKIFIQYESKTGKRSARSPSNLNPETTKLLKEITGLIGSNGSADLNRLHSNLRSIKHLYDRIPRYITEHDLWGLVGRDWTGLVRYYMRWIEGTPWARSRMSPAMFSAHSPIFTQFFEGVKREHQIIRLED